MRRLTDNAAADIDPAPAGDGRIAFISTRFGNPDLFVLGPTSTVRLTNNSFADANPTWSPDNHRIAFTSERNNNSDIYIVDADGSREQRLTRDPNFDFDPAFGSDGRIYFASDRAGSPQIFSMASNGSEVRQLTEGEASNTRPALSPDGRRVAFVSDRDGNPELYILNLSQGRPLGAPVRLTRDPGLDTDPAFTLDGRQIIFASNRSRGAGDFDIYQIDLDGSNVRAIVQGAGLDRVPRALRSSS